MSAEKSNRRGRRTLLSGAAVLLMVHAATLTGAQAQPPSFKSSVDVTSLDVTVVDGTGKPITDLAPGDFVVRIDGATRRVVTAEWVPLATPASDKPAGLGAAPGFSSNESETGGRLIVIVVDEPNIRFGGALGISRAVGGFIDRLAPSDRVAVASLGVNSPSTPFTADRERVKRAVARMAGQGRASRTMDLGHNISLTEAQAVERGDRATFDAVIRRECVNAIGPALEVCRQELEMELHSMVRDSGVDADDTIQRLRDLLVGLSRFDAPKTLILVSEGFVLTNEATIVELGTLAAQARTSLYALRLDNQMFDLGERRIPLNPFNDRQLRVEGLDMLTGAARGTMFTVTGTGDGIFARIEAELSGYYLLGVESDPRDRDGRSHSVRIDVPRKGALVRSRRQVLNAKSDRPAPRSPRAAVLSALSSPLLSSALPLRVGSYSLQGPESGKVQVLIHADIGTDYASSKGVAVGYVITDKDGRQVDTRSEAVRVSPTVNGVPSALQYTTGASLAPGEYSLRLAVAEGERVGTVEHTIRAALPDSGGVRLSELMVGGPAETGELLKPTIGYEVTFGSVHGYLEAYGSKLDSLTMEYEIATDDKAPALVNVDVPALPAGDTRAIFSRVVPVQQIPPGKYVLRAVLSADGRSIATTSRPFEIAPPKVLMTSAEGLGATSTDAELFLPVDDATMSPAFRHEDATRPDVIRQFADRIDPASKPAFEQGVAQLTAGDFAKAEASFKKAIAPEVDSTAPLTYLAAVFAASGHDVEAASAWQTALVDGSDFADIYDWLAGSLLREHQLAEARTILEEATGKWPADARFTKPLAMLYGAFGRGREAVRTLERYLEARKDDREAYYMAVQWLYAVHSAGAAVHNKADDLKLARTYADAYAKASGPQAALVRQWLDFLEKSPGK